MRVSSRMEMQASARNSAKHKVRESERKFFKRSWVLEPSLSFPVIASRKYTPILAGRKPEHVPIGRGYFASSVASHKAVGAGASPHELPISIPTRKTNRPP